MTSAAVAAVAPPSASRASSEPTAASPVARSTRGRPKVKPNSLLASRTATEYVYVGQDLRRIAVVAAGLFGALVVLWVLLVVMNLSGLY